MIRIEINLSKLERGLREEKVKVVRGGKTFYRLQRVGTKEEEKGDLASRLKVGEKIKFMGEEREIKMINELTGSFELDTGKSYTPKEINKYGESIEAKLERKVPSIIIGLNKPEPEKPKIEEKYEPKLEETSKIVGGSKDGSLSANDRKQATKNMEKFIGELEDEEKGKNIAGDDSVRKAGSYYTKGNAIDFNTYLIADKKEIMDFETYGLRNIEGEEKAEVDKRIKILDEFLDRAPKVKGVSYRAMWWDPNDPVQKKRFDDFISDLKPGNVVESKPYSSTTTSKKMMKDFTKMAKGGDITAHVEYESNGVYLNGESKSPEQQEVLIGHGVKFEVAGVEFSKNKKHVNIKFREVGLNE